MIWMLQLGKIQGGRTGHLNISHCVKAIHLVEELQHGTLDLALSAALAVIALGTDRINLINEHNGRGKFICHAEELANLQS